ncbi:MAG: hypothetical protein V7707_07960 [Motiliproteus sp.]
MGNTLWFIEILREQPAIGFAIGLVFAAFMFGSKNLIVYFYSRSQAKKQHAQQSLSEQPHSQELNDTQSIPPEHR